MTRSKLKYLAEKLEEVRNETGDPRYAELAAKVRNRIAERDVGHDLEGGDFVKSTYWLEAYKVGHVYAHHGIPKMQD